MQFLVWCSAAAFALAFLEQMRGNSRGADRYMVVALVAMLAGVITLAVNDVNGDPLNNCRETGGIQMVYVDGGWQCVPPGQES